MNSASLSLFSLSIMLVLVHQCQGRTMWEKFRKNYWESKDSLICYRTLTLQFFDSLKEVIYKIYVERAQKEFESKVKPRRQFFSYFDKDDDDSFEKRKKEAEKIAGKGLDTIRQWLIHHCTNEKQKQIMEITKKFKEGSTKCGDADYLSTPIMLLEQACPEEWKEGVANGKPTFARKNGMHGINGIDPWASVL